MTLLLALLAFSHPAMAADNLAAFHGPKEFCNVEQLAKAPSNEQTCRVLTLVKNDFSGFSALGAIQKFIDLGDETLVSSVMSLDELRAIQYDTRIITMSPDGPLNVTETFPSYN